jgi:putative ABC transport system permease protein
VSAVIVLTMVGLSLWQAPTAPTGGAFALALATTTGLLWLIAWAAVRATRRFFPRRASYVIRQGIANLHRPHNQTVAVTLAVGFGLFLIVTLYVVQRNLLDQLVIGPDAGRPNLLVFDIQRDQRDSIESIVHSRGLSLAAMTPIVPARIARVNDATVGELLADTLQEARRRWPLRREYRNTYRDTLVATERVTDGEWWSGSTGDTRGAPAGTRRTIPRISVEESLAEELAVGVGDRLTWDIQGVEIETEISSLREVDWARLELNFFVVFESGVLEDAPQSFVTLTSAPSGQIRAELQRDVVRAYSNVAILDLAAVQETIDAIVGSVAFAIRFMAVFSIVSGIIVLIGSIATSRFQRVRESVLLKTLGAQRRQVSHILLTEYSALGLLAGLLGTVLGCTAGWGVLVFMFEVDFRIPAAALGILWLATAATTAGIGLFNSREVFRKPPLAVIREMGE